MTEPAGKTSPPAPYLYYHCFLAPGFRTLDPDVVFNSPYALSEESRCSPPAWTIAQSILSL